jgi:5-methylcytosine-specific restriction endonuclease McrA
MNKKEAITIEGIRQMCHLAGLDCAKFLAEVETELKNRIKSFLTPNEVWFREGKSFERYWKFLEQITKHEWKYEDVDYWYKFVRDPSETREDIPPSLRYQVLIQDKSTCQRCGKKAPNVELEIDHILPWDCGGPTVADNLQTLCTECNIGKSNKCFEGGG